VVSSLSAGGPARITRTSPGNGILTAVSTRFPYLDAPVPLAFAHRGGAAEGDENTVAAFTRAVELGYRYIETDVRATADGVAVVFHDDTLDRMLGRSERLDQLRYADLATMRLAGEPLVSRLEDVLGAWPQLRFNIDVKSDRAVDPTVEVIRRTGVLDRVLLTAFSDARTGRLRGALGPGLATSLGRRGVGALWAASRLGFGARRPARRVAAAQVPVTAGVLRLVDERFVGYAHRVGLQVHVWTINNAEEMHDLLDLGVDGIMTDHITILRDVYIERGHWAA
jgi:glycerophosphoryl diester phosphodiesterase